MISLSPYITSVYRRTTHAEGREWGGGLSSPSPFPENFENTDIRVPKITANFDSDVP